MSRKPRPAELTRAALRAFPLPKVVDGEKDSKGRVLVIAGSRQVPGAALLAATAAMRAGAGRLRIATVESIAAELAIAMPEAYVIRLPEQRAGGLARSALKSIEDQAGHATVVIGGPGMERSKLCSAIAETLIRSPARVVLDAALLHGLSGSDPPRRDDNDPPVLLPHSGELAALLDCDEQEVLDDALGSGRRAAQLYRANVLVKGVQSHVISVDGRAWIYKGGAAGLGVSGSGDTLAGIVGGLLSRGADPLAALLWGVLLHGEAGEALSRKVGPVGFLAREIPEEIPALLMR